MVRFHLGTHQASWFTKTGVDLFVSDSRLANRRTLPEAQGEWALDSRGFSELKQHGRWTITPKDYAARVKRYQQEIGGMLWASPQDHMCEKEIIYGGQYGPLKYAGTRQFIDPDERMSYNDLVFEHQRLTVLNYAQLRDIDSDLPIIPVVQGDSAEQYVRCVDLYRDLIGVDLTEEPLIGVGSICRRQGTDGAGEIFQALHLRGVTRLHTYGLKINGLKKHARWLRSADSLAWSFGAWKYGERMLRHGLPHGLMPGCEPGPQHPARNCANCLPYALRWRENVLTATAVGLFTTRHEEKNDMTSTDTSSFFSTHQTRDVPRDQWGRYKLPGPDGEDVSWTRATTFAATLAESYALQIWKQRQVVWGLARRPDLITVASTIAGPEDKKALGEIVDEAHIAAGTDAKANRGTAIHRACQAAERGAWELVPAELRPHVQSYAAALKRGGLTMLPEYVERTVIVERYQVAGTFDNLVRCPDGKIRVLDKKTGSLDYAAIEFAVQLALYAHADAMFDYDSGRYERLPKIETDYAIIAHIDPENGDTELQRVNIEWGWVWARTAAEVMDIRRTKHVITPYVAPQFDGSAADDADTVSRMQAFGATQQEIDAFVNPQPAERPLPPPPPVIAEAAQIMHQVNANAAPNGDQPRTVPWVGIINEHTVRSGMVTPMDPPNTVPGGFVDTTSSVPDEFQAFWSDSRVIGGEDEEPAEQVNGVPLAEYGQPSRWPCASNQPCEFTAATGLHSDGTVCLYGNSRPGPIPAPEPTPPSPTETAAVASEGASEPIDTPSPVTQSIDDTVTVPTAGVPDEAMVAKIGKLSKDVGKAIAQRLMERLGIAERDSDAINIKKYKTEVARAIVTLAFQRGASIPGPTDDAPDLGVPTGPAPGAEQASTVAPGSVPAQQRADEVTREQQIRTAVESIMMQNSIPGIQERHTYYSGTSLGWTDEMQNAARTRAAELEQASGETPLTPLEMIQGATSRETLAKAYAKATGDGTDRSGWTPELNAAAEARFQEIAATIGVAMSGS